jgi:ABC-type antimicrobial peptide transport system permease subunit
MASLTPINIRLAVRSLGRNRLRTALTMLGIIIGVAAVLTMVALGTGARASVEGTVSSAGTNLIFVKAGNYTRGGETVGIQAGSGAAKTLTSSDREAIAKEVKGIADLSPTLQVRSFLTSDNARAFAKVQGVETGFATMYAWTFSKGKNFKGGDLPEAVLGHSLATNLFGVDNNPVGKVIKLRDVEYTVVGVVDGQSDDQAEVMFVPWRMLQKSLGFSHVEGLTVAAQKAGETSRIADDISKLLRSRHGIKSTKPPQGYLAATRGGGDVPDDFTVTTQAAAALTKGLYTPAAAFALASMPKLDEVTLAEMSDTLDRSSDTMTALLASIAGVSLIVGGIGIMNIMLVAITERTREIGLRMASGARSGDVASLFLIEAVTLSVIGGFIGLVLGLLTAKLVGWSLGWPATVSPSAMALAIGISALIGLIFGSYPARRASLLDPIQALRTE